MQCHFHEDSNSVILFSVEAMLTEFVLNGETELFRNSSCLCRV